MDRRTLLRGAGLVVLLPLVINVAAAALYDALKPNLGGVGDVLRSPWFAIVIYVVLAIAWLVYWSRVAPQVATAAEAAELRQRVRGLEAELESKHRSENREFVQQLIQEGDSLAGDYRTNAYPHADDDAKMAPGWVRVETWEQKIKRILTSEQIDDVMGEISLAPVTDQPWWTRISYHVGIRVGRLKRLASDLRW